MTEIIFILSKTELKVQVLLHSKITNYSIVHLEKRILRFPLHLTKLNLAPLLHWAHKGPKVRFNKSFS